MSADSTPTLSVVMPVYNSMPHLVAAIESVLRQSLETFELIVADDGSRDESVATIERMCDPRIVFYRNERNLGIFGNLNQLCRRARAPLIKIFCADDVMMEECLERQVAFMNAHPTLGFSRCHGVESNFSQARPPLCWQPRLPEIIYPRASALAFLTFGNIPGNLTNVIVRTSAYHAVEGFSENLPYAGDMEMWTRMAARFPFGIQQDRLVMVRQHARQASFLLNRHNQLLPQADRVYASTFAGLNPVFHRRVRWGHALYHGDYWVNDWLRRLLECNWRGLAALFVRRSFSVGVWWWFVCFGLRLKGVFGRRYVEGNLARIGEANQAG